MIKHDADDKFKQAAVTGNGAGASAMACALIQAKMKDLSHPEATSTQYRSLCEAFWRLAEAGDLPSLTTTLREIAPDLVRNYHFDPDHCLRPEIEKREPLIDGIVSRLSPDAARSVIEVLTKDTAAWMTEEVRMNYSCKLDRLSFSFREVLFPTEPPDSGLLAARGKCVFECLAFLLDADDPQEFSLYKIQIMNGLWERESAYMTPAQRSTLIAATPHFIETAQSYYADWIPDDAFRFFEPS